MTRRIPSASAIKALFRACFHAGVVTPWSQIFLKLSCGGALARHVTALCTGVSAMSLAVALARLPYSVPLLLRRSD